MADRASHLDELVALFLGLDAFGDDGDVELVAEGENRTDDRGVALAGADLVDEHRVDLEGADGKLPEVGEGRPAGAEVVDRDLDPDADELAEGGRGAVEIVDESGLGDLEPDLVCAEVVAIDEGDEVANEVFVELSGRDVHGDVDITVVSMPPAQLRTGQFEHVGADVGDDAGSFRGFDELDGRNPTAVGVLPADEGFVADDRSVVEANDRLVLDEELVVGESALDLVDEGLLRGHAMGEGGHASDEPRQHGRPFHNMVYVMVTWYDSNMPRVTRTDYYDQAIRILGQDGSSALTIGALSEALDVTSGSFYHHFGSWNGFVTGLVEHWEQEQTERVIALTQPAANPLARFDRLVELAVDLPHAAEAAIRAWASNEPIVARAQRRVDTERIQFVDELMTDLVDDAERGRRLGVAVVATYIGLQQLGPQLGETGFQDALLLLRDLIASDAAPLPGSSRRSPGSRKRRDGTA